MSADLAFMNAIELRAAIQSGEVSSVEATENFFQRIERLDPQLNSYLALCQDQALADARAADEAVRRGDATGQLHGIPISIKDLEMTKGVPTTLGSALFQGRVPDVDSIVVERVKAAGAVVLGKTNTPEFGQSGTTENKLGEPCRNPWNTETDLRRLLRRGRGGGGGGPLHHSHRKRRRGFGAHSRQLQRHFRHQTVPRPGAALRRVWPPGGQPLLPIGPNDPDRGRLRPAAAGNGGAGLPGRELDTPGSSRLQRRTQRGRQRHADRVEPRLRLCRGGPRGGQRHGGRGPAVRRAGGQCGRARPGDGGPIPRLLGRFRHSGLYVLRAPVGGTPGRFHLLRPSFHRTRGGGYRRRSVQGLVMGRPAGTPIGGLLRSITTCWSRRPWPCRRSPSNSARP